MPGPPRLPQHCVLGSDTAEQCEVQLRLWHHKPSASLNGCQDMVGFGVPAFPADPAKLTEPRAEGSGSGIHRTLYGTYSMEGTWPKHGVAALTPVQPGVPCLAGIVGSGCWAP